MITLSQKNETFVKIGDFDINIATRLYNVAYKINKDNKVFKNHLASKNADKKTPHEVSKDAGLVLSVLFDYFGFWSRRKDGNIKNISINDLEENLLIICNFLTIFYPQKTP